MLYAFDKVFVEREWYPVRPTVAIRCRSSEYARRFRMFEYRELFLQREYKGILSLTFDDINPARDGKDNKGYVLFDENLARQIKLFIQENMGKFEDVMVHCDDGISRSCAVAAALGDYYGWEYDGGIWFRSERGTNMLVYDTLTRILEQTT